MLVFVPDRVRFYIVMLLMNVKKRREACQSGCCLHYDKYPRVHGGQMTKTILEKLIPLSSFLSYTAKRLKYSLNRSYCGTYCKSDYFTGNSQYFFSNNNS